MTVHFELHKMEMLEKASDIFCRSVCLSCCVRFVQCCVMLMSCSTVKSLSSSVRWEDQGLSIWPDLSSHNIMNDKRCCVEPGLFKGVIVSFFALSFSMCFFIGSQALKFVRKTRCSSWVDPLETSSSVSDDKGTWKTIGLCAHASQGTLLNTKHE